MTMKIITAVGKYITIIRTNMARTIFGEILETAAEAAEPLTELASDAVDYAKDVKDDVKDTASSLWDSIFGD